jgi:hypothetical protein
MLIANADNKSNAKHTIDISGKKISWTGPYSVLINGKAMN